MKILLQLCWHNGKFFGCCSRIIESETICESFEQNKKKLVKKYFFDITGEENMKRNRTWSPKHKRKKIDVFVLD